MTNPSQILDRLRSRSSGSLLLIVALTLNSRAQSNDTQPHAVTLVRGRVLEMKLVKRLDSSRAKIGDDFVLKLTKPLLADGVTILPIGWTVHGRITDAKPAAKNCQRGFIDWELEPVTTTDGQKIEIQSIAEEVTRQGIFNQAPHDPGDPTGGKALEKPAQKTSSRPVRIVKGIVIVPLVIVMLPVLALALLSEGRSYDPCPRGKGHEDSISAGNRFYGEVSNDIQRVVK